MIGLPANIFYGTSIPTCILVFKSVRTQSENVLFIDASAHFEKVKNQNVLRQEHIDKIISTYEQREAQDKYSYVASMDEIIENDYNLNIPRYVDTFEEEEPVDLDAVSSELQGLETELQETNDTIADFCKQLNIKTPFNAVCYQNISVPKLRFEEFDGDWSTFRLNQIANRVKTKNKENSLNNVLTNSATEGIVNQSDFFDEEIANTNNLENYYVVQDLSDYVYNPRISKHAPVGPIKKSHNRFRRNVTTL